MSYSFNSLMNSITTMPFIGKVFNNPLFTTLLITAMIAVIIMGVFHYPKKTERKSFAKAIVYSFIIILCVQVIHYYALNAKFVTTGAAESIDNTFNSIFDRPISNVNLIPPPKLNNNGFDFVIRE